LALASIDLNSPLKRPIIKRVKRARDFEPVETAQWGFWLAVALTICIAMASVILV
jgi:hypothetical protein